MIARTTRRWTWMGLLAVFLAAGWLFAREADPLNRVADGDFEAGFVSLSLPAVDHFPLVINGWATRGTPVPEIINDSNQAFEGSHALRLRSHPREPVHLLQDLPLSTTSYRLELAFYPEAGRQAVKLLSGWDREVPGSEQFAIGIFLSADGWQVITPAGRWSLDQPISTDRWHSLEVVSDARTDVQTVALDGHLAVSLPGLPVAPPTTLLIGDSGRGGESSYRYDSLRLVQLAEEELFEVRLEASSVLSDDPLRWMTTRLEAAAAALDRGAPTLALPELRAARRLLKGEGNAAATRSTGAAQRGSSAGELARHLDSLIELFQRSR
ncbi:MAG: hypothetical protein ACE5HV_07130 [Acidobacteriota bacterium]